VYGCSCNSSSTLLLRVTWSIILQTQVALYDVLLHNEMDLLHSRCLLSIQWEGPRLLCRSKVIVFRYFGTKACFMNTKLKVYKTYMMKHVWNETTTKVLRDRCSSKDEWKYTRVQQTPRAHFYIGKYEVGRNLNKNNHFNAFTSNLILKGL